MSSTHFEGSTNFLQLAARQICILANFRTFGLNFGPKINFAHISVLSPTIAYRAIKILLTVGVDITVDGSFQNHQNSTFPSAVRVGNHKLKQILSAHTLHLKFPF